MNNFLVKIKGDERLNNEIKTVFTKNFNEEKNYEKKKNVKYILTERYVDEYITPFLIKEEGDYYCVLCELNLSSFNEKSNNSFQNILNLYFYSSHIYFEDIEKDQYEIKINGHNKKYKEYKIKNKNVLLLYGDFNYINNDKKRNKENRNKMKELYYYIKENKHNLNDCFNNIEGSFILIYAQYENNKVNFFFFNDNFGKRSFIFFHVNNSIILTNLYGFFINYDFNYICLNDENYLFDDNSIKEEFNLINHHDIIYRKPFTDNGNYNSNKNIKENKNMNCINEKIAINIRPHYIYNLLIEKNDVILKNLKKTNCIYNIDYEWSNKNLSVKENFEYMLNFFKQNNFFGDFSKEEQINLEGVIENLINKKIEYQQENRYVTNKDIFTETKLNNIFINLHITLLNNVVKKKIEETFECTKESKIQKEKDEENINGNLKDDEKKKSIGILFSGGIDSTLLTILTIKNFFCFYKNGYIELINVAFNENSVDRYTSLISYENIINLFPFYDIRLVFIDVSPDELIEYEKIIYSLISPNNTIMDYNISSALFFANIGRGYICSPTFFKSYQWNIIKKCVFNILNVNYSKQINQNGLKENDETYNKVKVEKEEKKKNIKKKCTICEFVMNKKCIHRCCSSCCRKLRYIYFNEFYLNKEQMMKKKNSTVLSKNVINNNTNTNTNIYKKEEESSIDIYEVTYDEKTSKKCIYLLIKKKKILIDFKIFPECNKHKEKLYDYKKIGTLFFEFNKELEEKKRYEKNKFKTYLNNENIQYSFNDYNKIMFDEILSVESGDSNKKSEIEDEEEKVKNMKEDNTNEILNEVNINKVGEDNFIEYFAAKKADKNMNNFYKIKSLFSVKNKRKEEYSSNKNEDKIFIDNLLKKEEECLNYLNRRIYNSGNTEKVYYQCNHKLLIIGSGADELYGGYYRQNNSNVNKNLDTNFKMNEMIKDIKRLWIRNLYRDDRILSFTNISKKYIFYPFLNIKIINFLFLLSFYIIESPIPNFYSIQKKMDDGKNESSLLNIASISEVNKEIKNGKIKNENKLDKANFNFLKENLEECYKIYEIIENHKISKWILRMSIFFLKMKEVMFFKKKAIQFGSKAKDIRKYMKESLYRFNNKGDIIFDKNDKKGDNYYVLLS
ncbi:conserved Plasmodium protein, unknown function [Plasmodium relictum]|uniref:Asparagine synthase n=1 Tax=Plasmodium relictum TaxID=85471 RepID=A0A1J1H9H4_PLARL|nr:conserved Plasmodium protein, unknown function [Plasmodium relictum]CRH01159.1 conserved Plasmodium protein, unknown function [Plasmodium relictum]